jgi:hypothetical protein
VATNDDSASVAAARRAAHRPVHVESVSAHTAAVRGVPGSALAELRVPKQWSTRLACWTVPAGSVEVIAGWAAAAGRPVVIGLAAAR